MKPDPLGFGNYSYEEVIAYVRLALAEHPGRFSLAILEVRRAFPALSLYMAKELCEAARAK